MKISITSNEPASKDQVRRVRALTAEALEIALEAQFTKPELQAVHDNSGPYKEEFAADFLNFVRAFSRKARGLFVPVKAQDTGLVPEGWTLESDDLETEIDVTKLDFSHCPVLPSDKDGWINGDTLVKRAGKISAIGSLGFGKIVLDAQKEGKHIIPPELMGKIYIPLIRTILRNRNDNRYVAYLHSDGKQWVVYFLRLVSLFFVNARLPRRRE